MPTFDELRARYMVGGGSGETSGGSGGGGSGGASAGLSLYTQNRITPLIHGSRYFPELKAAIDRLGSGSADDQFIYLTGWWLDVPFSLDGSGTRLVDLLKAKARAGVDVRILGWVMAPEILQDSRVQGAGNAEVQSMLALNNETVAFVKELRTEPRLADKAALNILAHPAGAVHMKMVLVGDGSQAVGFTGGIDLQDSRHLPLWHDVQAKVEGPVVQELFGVFRNMWNEVRGRTPVRLTIGGGRVIGGTFVRKSPVTGNSHSSSMPDLPHRTLHSTTSAQMVVQSAVTYPQFNFSLVHSTLNLPTNQSLGFAPNGRFDVKQVWQHAIGAAESYVYMEDQAFTSTELFDWINARIKSQSDLRVILVIGGNDPTAPGGSLTDMKIAINDHLLAGLNSAQLSRVGLFGRRDQHNVNGRMVPTFVHTKTTIIDDRWAMIGSANAMRRSLYTDLEHTVAFMDAQSHASVVDYRTDLWQTHLEARPASMSDALNAWFGLTAGTPAPAGKVNRLPLPLPSASRSSLEQIIYDELTDPDSRQSWGGAALIRALMSASGSALSTP